MKFKSLFVITLAAAGLWACKEDLPRQMFDVVATSETTPGPHKGDIIDDPAVWVNKKDRSKSVIVGTDKSKEGFGGLRLYDLQGEEINFLQVGAMNNVDVRYNFPLAGEKVDLVVASNRDENTLAVFKVVEEGRNLVDVTGRKVNPVGGIYGLCLYRHKGDGHVYAFLTTKSGLVQQWRLTGNKEGAVDARLVRSFEVGSKTEGVVADDEKGNLYVAEENVGLWRYSAAPDAGESRVQVDQVGKRLADDVEGLTLYYGPKGTGFLIASSQGNSTFSVYERQGDNKYIKSFRIIDGPSIKGARKTDGITVVSHSLGALYPAGLFVAHSDGFGTGVGSNFKLVSWDLIEPHLKQQKK